MGFFCPKGKKSLGRSPLQELELSTRSGLYLLVQVTPVSQVMTVLSLIPLAPVIPLKSVTPAIVNINSNTRLEGEFAPS